MFSCDLCGHMLVKGKTKWVQSEDNSLHICIDCVKICKTIVDDPNTGNLTYLHEYKNKLEERGINCQK